MVIYMELPKDPYILLSYINTKLRNDFHTLEDLCNSLRLNKEQLTSSLSDIGYRYSPQQNQFVSAE